VAQNVRNVIINLPLKADLLTSRLMRSVLKFSNPINGEEKVLAKIFRS
jgi:hypothetical protein